MSDRPPAVSIVIPLFNRAATLARAIDSVRAQDIADWELLVVDDGSTDDGAAVAEAYGDPRIRVLRHPANRGAAAARNTGVRAARGPVIAFLDSDDEWLPGVLTAQLAVLGAAGPDAPDLVCTAFLYSRDGRRSLRVPRSTGTWFETFLDGCHVSPGSTLAARRSCFDIVGPLDEGLGRLEDWDWLLRAAAAQRFACLEKPGALIHAGRHPGYAAIRKATGRLWTLQADRVRRVAGAAGCRRLRASLAIECGVAALREGRRLLGAAWLAEAGRRSPTRLARLLLRRLDAGSVVPSA